MLAHWVQLPIEYNAMKRKQNLCVSPSSNSLTYYCIKLKITISEDQNI